MPAAAAPRNGPQDGDDAILEWMEETTVTITLARLPELLRELSRCERLTVTIQDGSQEPALCVHMLSDAVFQALLEQVRVPVRATYTRDDTAPHGWWTMDQDALGAAGDGATRDAALLVLAQAVVLHARGLAQDLGTRHGGVSRPRLAILLRVLCADQSGGTEAVRRVLEDGVEPMVTVVTREGSQRTAIGELIGAQ